MSESEKSCPLHPSNSTFICEKGRIGHTPCHFYNPTTQQCVIFDISENLRDIPRALAFFSLEFRRPMKPPVLFTDLNEYVHEITLDKDGIYRGIVRGYKETRESETGVKAWYVVSTYIAGAQIIRFEKRSGRYSNDILKKIEQTCIDALLEFRSGAMKG